MIISVTVKPRSARTRVVKLSGNEYVVAVSAPPREGRANAAIVEALSDFFAVSKSRVTILRGDTSKHKVIEVCLES